MRPPWRCPTNSCPRLWSQAWSFLLHDECNSGSTNSKSEHVSIQLKFILRSIGSIHLNHLCHGSLFYPTKFPSSTSFRLSLSLSLAPSLLLTVFQCETYKVSIWTTDPLQVASFWQLMVPFHWRWKAAEVIMLSQRPNLRVRYFREGIRKAFPSPSSRCLVQVMNDIAIGEKKNMNLPGVKVDLPVLQDLHLNLLGEFVLDGGLMWMYVYLI